MTVFVYFLGCFFLSWICFKKVLYKANASTLQPPKHEFQIQRVRYIVNNFSSNFQVILSFIITTSLFFFLSWILSHRFSVESPVVILGDKSGSMDIAIRTSSIIAGILAVVTSAKLIFFDDKCMDAPYVPISVQEVINLAMEVKAGGGTCPAAALLPFYDRKEVVKTFVIVTDEEEAESESSTNLK